MCLVLDFIFFRAIRFWYKELDDISSKWFYDDSIRLKASVIKTNITYKKVYQ